MSQVVCYCKNVTKAEIENDLKDNHSCCCK